MHKESKTTSTDGRGGLCDHNSNSVLVGKNFPPYNTPAYAGDMTGVIYQNTKEHLTGAGTSATEKSGKATCIQVFGIVAKGDCTLSTAM